MSSSLTKFESLYFCKMLSSTGLSYKREPFIPNISVVTCKVIANHFLTVDKPQKNWHHSVTGFVKCSLRS